MRFIGLETRPNGLFRDEAEKGYNAWALWHEGGVIEFRPDAPGGPVRPVFRSPWMFVNVMGSLTPALYHRLAGPFVAIFGLDAAAVRMPAALAGMLTVALIGVAFIPAWGARYGLAVAFWLAACPWHYVFSRWAQQGILVPFALCAMLAGLRAANQGKAWGFPLAGFFLGFCFHLYTGTQPFVLLYLVLLGLLYRKHPRETSWALLLGIALAFAWIVPTLLVTLLGDGESRLARVAVWHAPDATPFITCLRIPLHWIAHFNPWFLFASGDSLARHGIPGLGQLLLADALLLPFGILTAFRRNMPLRRELLAMLLAAPAGAAITWGHIPHSLRAIPMIVPCVAFSGVGIIALNDLLTTRSRERPWLRFLKWVLLAALAFHAARVFLVYWTLAESDPRFLHAESGFARSTAAAFEEMGDQRIRGGLSQIWLDARIPYAPYYAFFYGKFSARELNAGLESSGIHLFDPSGVTAPRMSQPAPGDGIIMLDPQGEGKFVIYKPSLPSKPLPR